MNDCQMAPLNPKCLIENVNSQCKIITINSNLIEKKPSLKTKLAFSILTIKRRVLYATIYYHTNHKIIVIFLFRNSIKNNVQLCNLSTETGAKLAKTRNMWNT